MKTHNLATQLTEAFAAQGYSGKELTLRVLAAGHVLAVATGNAEAAAHFARRHNETEAGK